MTFNASTTNQWNSTIASSIGQVQAFLRDNYGIDTLVAVSSLHSEASEIKASFKEAMETMEYLELAGNRTFARYSQITLQGRKREHSTAQREEEALLLGYIKSGDFTKARKHFNEIIDTYFFHTPDSVHALKFRLYALLSKILIAVDCIDAPTLYTLLQKINTQNKLPNCENIAEFQTELNTLFVELEKSYNAIEASERESFIKDIQSIIEINYRNPDLNVSLIADMMDKNLDTISRMFTKATGMGLLDYIHAIRIRKAKEIMQANKTFSVQKVAIMVGYVNCESFIRVFKRKEGLTPGRYKVTVLGS